MSRMIPKSGHRFSDKIMRKQTSHGLWEMRVDYGPGYCVYFKYRVAEIVILLCGGDKRTQRRDIKRAQDLAEQDDA
jgi:putative addiction module killer protein